MNSQFLAIVLLFLFVFTIRKTDETSVKKRYIKDLSKVNGKNETDCKDDKDKCEYHWSRGWYTCDVGGVLYDLCKDSCGYCGKDPIPKPNPHLCKDYEPECGQWSKYGDCIHNKEFMEKYCRKSCKFCLEDTRYSPINVNCVNRAPDCRSKAKQNQCLYDKIYMSKNCHKACNMCDFYSQCNDSSSLCNWWKKKGYCKTTSSYHGFMEKKCRYSCQLCQ